MFDEDHPVMFKSEERLLREDDEYCKKTLDFHKGQEEKFAKYKITTGGLGQMLISLQGLAKGNLIFMPSVSQSKVCFSLFVCLFFYPST